VAKRKLEQFAQFTALENTFEFAKENKGQWNKIFGNDNPIVLELACGYGHYASTLAERTPHINYIGIDRKANRMWHGAMHCAENNITNARFLRISIDDVNLYFDTDEVSEIWITFPDPQPKDRTAKNRLIHPKFLERYLALLKPNGIINLKTDSTLLYNFTKRVIDECKLPLFEDNADIYNWADRPDFLDIKTFYEKIWLKEGKTIKYIKFGLKKGAFDWIEDMKKYC